MLTRIALVTCLLALQPPIDYSKPFIEPVKIIHEFDGEAAGDQFGWIARPIGDVDGDRVTDVIISAPGDARPGSTSAGHVYAYSGRTGKLLWKADGKPGDLLGLGVEGAGDTNHDGIPDVVATAAASREARVFSGKDGTLLRAIAVPIGEAAERVGHAAGIGDVNGDGCDDIIVGTNGAPADMTATGHAFVFSGRDGQLLLTLTGERGGDRFGSAVAGASSRAGLTLVIGAPGGGPARHGRVYVYRQLQSKPAFTADADDAGAALGGMFVSVPGDFNGDGIADVYATDFGNNAKGKGTGRAYVYSGADGHVLLTLTGETAGEGFGIGSAIAGDVNKDGVPDLIVGSWLYGAVAQAGGRAYLISGKDGAVLQTYTGRVAGEAFGFDAVAIGDADGDGSIDLLITSAWSGIHGAHSGRAFVISAGLSVSRGTRGSS